MSYEQKSGDVVIFKNNHKESDNHPDYKGKGLDLEGNEIEIALWIKEGKSGKFFSGRIQPKFNKIESKPAEPAQDDLPF